MNQRLVYDSDAPLGRVSPSARARREATRDDRPPAPASRGLPNDGVVRLLRDRKGRGGKTVTLVAGLPRGTALEPLASELKRLCGTGGTVRDDVIEIQGDVRERIKPVLEKRGYTVKIAGG
jgi:translation initiation factor 1